MEISFRQFSWTQRRDGVPGLRCDPFQYDALRAGNSKAPSEQEEPFVPLDFSHGLNGPDYQQQQQQQAMSEEARAQLALLEGLAKELYTSVNTEQRKKAEEMLKAEALSGDSLKKLQIFLRCSQSEYLTVKKKKKKNIKSPFSN